MAAAGTSSFVQVSRPLYPAVLFSLTRVHRSEGGGETVCFSFSSSSLPEQTVATYHAPCPSGRPTLPFIHFRHSVRAIFSAHFVRAQTEGSPLFSEQGFGANSDQRKGVLIVRAESMLILSFGFFSFSRTLRSEEKEDKKKSCLGAPMRRETKIKRSHPRSSIKVRSRDQRPATSLVFFLLRLSSKLRITTEEEIEKNISEVDGPGHTELVGNCTI